MLNTNASRASEDLSQYVDVSQKKKKIRSFFFNATAYIYKYIHANINIQFYIIISFAKQIMNVT